MTSTTQRESPVTFVSGDVTLAGALATPDGARPPFPTALLIAGSGPLDRNGNHQKMALELSRDLAGILAGAGWASLRFDKRGVGESGGDYLSSGFFDEFADVEAALQWLRDQEDFGPIIAVGHSAGALMAAELASRPRDVAGAVLLAATAKTGEETLRWQTEQMQDHIVPAPVSAVLRLFGTSVVKQQEKAVARLKTTTTDTARIQLVKTNARWMREFIAYDPVPTLRRAQVPLLAITGSKDVQVDATDLALIADVAPEGSQTIVVDGVDHLLRNEVAPISSPRNYRKQIKKPIDPRVVAALTEWLQSIAATSASAGEEQPDV